MNEDAILVSSWILNDAFLNSIINLYAVLLKSKNFIIAKCSIIVNLF